MDHNIPEFMKKYHDGSDEEGKEHINRIAARYESDRSDFFQTTAAHKQSFQSDWNKQTGQSNQISQDDMIQPLNQKYEAEVKAVALEYGYVEQEQEQQDGHEEHQAQDDQREQGQQTNAQQPDATTPELEKQQTARKEFLQNLETIRARVATRVHRSRQ